MAADALLTAQNDRAGLRPLDAKLEEAMDEHARAQAHALRAAARIVGAAGLPAEYRASAFGLVAEVELARELAGMDPRAL